MISDPGAQYEDRLENLLTQVERYKAAVGSEPHAHYADELQYAKELVSFAAVDLAFATDALPPEDRPVGWSHALW